MMCFRGCHQAVLAVVCLAVSFGVFAQSNKPQPEQQVRDPIEDSLLTGDPESILKLRAGVVASQKAMRTTKRYRVINQSIVVNDAPGSETPTVVLLPKNPSVIVFSDIAGGAWPIVRTNIIDSSWLKCVASADSTKACGTTENTIELYTDSFEGQAHFMVYLKDRPLPIHIRAVASENQAIYNPLTEIQIADIHSSSAGGTSLQLATGSSLVSDEDLSGVLYGVKPGNSVPIETDSDLMTVWRQGNDLIVVTKMELISPIPSRQMNSQSGNIAYRTPLATRFIGRTPEGRSVRVRVSVDG